MTTPVRRPLWVSTDPQSPGGYGVATAEFLPLIKRAGYDVALYAFWGGKMSPTLWSDEEILVLPPLQPGAHSDIVLAHAAYHRADVVITLVDPLAVPTAAYQKLFWVAWTPSDSEPVAPANVTALQVADVVWSMSRHGHEQLKLAGFDPVYVPLSVNTTTFTPRDRPAARAALVNTLHDERGNEHVSLDDDTFLIVMNAANLSRPCRKGFWEALAAFKQFSETHDNAVLYIHTDRIGRNGEPVDRWIGMTGVDPQKVWFPPTYYYLTGLIGQEWLSYMYSAADVFLQPSRGEGFGLPIVEAQACGTPVIVTDFSSMPELTFAGWKVPGVSVPALNPGCLHLQPDISKLADALEAAYSARGDATLRQEARRGAMQYDTATVFERYLKPALEQTYVAYDQAHREKATEVPRLHLGESPDAADGDTKEATDAA